MMSNDHAGRPRRSSGSLCYTQMFFQQLTSSGRRLRGKRLKQVASLLVTFFFILMLVGCGGGSSTPNAPVTKLANRVFITNAYTGNLQVMNDQTDVTAYNPAGYNSQGQLVNGAPITISVGTSASWEVRTPDKTLTAVYDPRSETVNFVDNNTETSTAGVFLGGFASGAVWSADSKTVYVPVRNLATNGATNGGVQAITAPITSSTTSTAANLAATYPVPSARWIAITPDGKTLLVFPDNADVLYLIDLTATSPAAVQVPGFARPVNAFFSSDSSTAYVLNCGPECASSAGPPSVAKLDLPSRTIKASVTVGGATVGLLSGTALYVAGNPGPAGTVDVVDVNAMARTTTSSVAIGDGYHDTMALAQNKQLYIGASTCSNITVGCLSFFNTSNNTAGSQSQPQGNVTGMVAIPSRDAIYVIEGGYLRIYNTDTNQLGTTQIVFQGALSDVILIDQ
jgi:hypothetical protein